MKNYSEATAVAIDEEIRSIVEENYKRTREILAQNREALIMVSEALLERENLEGSELRAMVFGEEQVAEADDAVEADAVGGDDTPAEAEPVDEA